MRIKDILVESSTDLVARFYKEASKDDDQRLNSEACQIAEQNKDYYREFFKDWFKEGVTPVFTVPVTKPQPAYRNRPQPDQRQSPGYRGQQYAKKAAGLPYDHHVQEYNPNHAPATIDGQLNA